MPTRNEEMRSSSIRHQMALLTIAATASRSLDRHFNNGLRNLREAIRPSLSWLTDERMKLSSNIGQVRLNKLSQAIRDAREKRFVEARRRMRKYMIGVMLGEWAFMRAVTKAVYGRIVARPSDVKATDILEAYPIQGRTFPEWMRDLQEQDERRIYGAVIGALFAGQKPDGILAAAVSTNGATSLLSAGMAALLATATSAYSAQSRAAMVAENTDVYGQEQFVAVLDNRTTPLCRGLDGKVYPVGEGPIPPLHWRCRSTRVPYVDGDVPERMTYNDWLATQTVEFQDDVLGPTRGKLFREGGMTLNSFIASDNTYMTLGQLAEFHTVNFKRAGLDPNAFIG